MQCKTDKTENKNAMETTCTKYEVNSILKRK
jgi:hypothetical protein